MRISNALQALLLIIVLALPGEAMAKDPDVLLQEAIVNFRMGQFRKSIKLLKRAGRKARDDKLKAQIQLYLGMNYGVRKKWKLARRAFKIALKLDPLQQVTDEVAKKTVVKLYREVRDNLLGRLRVTADQQKVTVELDGKAVGTAPYEARIPVGKHRLVLKTANGLYRKEAVVVVWYGKKHEVQGPLEFGGGRLSVTSVPPGARVLIDGKAAGTTPLTALELAAGAHELTLELEGHDAHTSKLALQPGKAVSTDIALTATPQEPAPEPAPASLPVAAPVAPSETPPPSKRKWPVWTMVTAGIAVAAAGVGLGLGLSYKSAISDYEATDQPTRYDELREDIPRLETGTNVSLAVAGAAVVATALVYFFVDRPAIKAEQPSVSPSPGGAVLSWGF